MFRSPAEASFSYTQEVPKRIPRAWDRAPKSPFGGRHGGRKVWKRYETLPKDHGDKSEEAGLGYALNDTTNTSHSVKRLRLKGAPGTSIGGKENKDTEYLATLQDEDKETPKRNLHSSGHGFVF